MFTYFKLAEDNPSILKETLEYNKPIEILLRQTIEPEQQLESGKTYTINELIFRMIAYSDNAANHLLQSYLKKFSPKEDLLEETFKELGVIDPKKDIYTEALSAKTYGSFFRLLYNSSYLSKEFSNRSLEYLTLSDYGHGISKTIPKGISVAHKFGERFLAEGRVQLHDCGIIYYPENPYLLCVMTEGGDFAKLSEIISSVSKEVWEEINSRKL
jgi:beta-lactamase class A